MDSHFSKIVDIIINAGCIQGFFFAFVLNSKKNKKKKSNKILSVLLIILSISIFHSIYLLRSNFFIQNSPFRISEPFILLIGPFLLFYIKELTTNAVKFTFKDTIHFIPFVLFFVITAPIHIFGEISGYYKIINKYSYFINIILWILIITQYVIYYVKIFHIIGAHRINVESEYSNIEEIKLSWLKVFLFVFLVVLIPMTLALSVLIHEGNYASIDRNITLILSISIYILGYKGMLQKEIFTNSEEEQNTLTQNIITEEANIQIENKLPQENYITKPSNEDNEIVKKLIEYMEEKKPFLDENISLTTLAKKINVTRNRLSQIINKNLNDNFYNFINKYRVEEVKSYLADPKNQKFTMLSLAFQAGFPSKSSFNNIFKKFTGLTPTEYRDRLP